MAKHTQLYKEVVKTNWHILVKLYKPTVITGGNSFRYYDASPAIFVWLK